MKVIIVGCGKMGSELARALCERGDEVVIIDSNEKSFELLWKGFTGTKLVGIGFDKEVLESSGIETADAIVSCTHLDETNALIARMSWQRYRVPRAIARLYDPRKASIYNTLGIQTISTTTWGIRKVTQLLSYKQLDSVAQLGNDDIDVVRVDIPILLQGKPINYFNRPGEIQVVMIQQQGNKIRIPTDGTIMQKDDVLHIAVANSAMDTLKDLISL